jgi:NAD(P)H dehydrogenase (quinone)
LAYHVPCISAAARGEVLDARAPLVFPSVDDFDENLRPKAGVE